MSGKHTPGPWTVEPYGLSSFRVFGPGRRKVALVPGRPSRVAEANANARLIGAAPDLLDALRAAADYLGPEPAAPGYPSIQHATVTALIRQVRAAIAKATGER